MNVFSFWKCSHDQHINRLHVIRINLKSSKMCIHPHTHKHKEMCTRTIILLEASLSTITIAMSAVHRTQSLCYLVKFVSTPERDVNIQSSHRRGGERNSKSVSRGKDARKEGLSVIQRCPNSWVKGRESSLPSFRPTEKTSLSERTWAWEDDRKRFS